MKILIGGKGKMGQLIRQTAEAEGHTVIGMADAMDLSALNAEENELTVFVLNADWEDAHEFTLDVRGFDGWKFIGHSCLNSTDPDARNTFEHPDVIIPREIASTRMEDGICSAVLPALSWNVFRFKK